MNTPTPQELRQVQQLREAADIIEQGLEWSWKDLDGQTFICNKTDFLFDRLKDGCEICRKPIKWAAEREAFARGEKIKFRVRGMPNWHDVVGNPVWEECSGYRVKPTTALMPLDKASTPVGSIVRYIGGIAHSMVLTVTSKGIVFMSDTPGIREMTFSEMQKHMEICYPGHVEFQPCSKPAP